MNIELFRDPKRDNHEGDLAQHIALDHQFIAFDRIFLVITSPIGPSVNQHYCRTLSDWRVKPKTTCPAYGFWQDQEGLPTSPLLRCARDGTTRKTCMLFAITTRAPEAVIIVNELDEMRTILQKKRDQFPEE